MPAWTDGPERALASPGSVLRPGPLHASCDPPFSLLLDSQPSPLPGRPDVPCSPSPTFAGSPPGRLAGGRGGHKTASDFEVCLLPCDPRFIGPSSGPKDLPAPAGGGRNEAKRSNQWSYLPLPTCRRILISGFRLPPWLEFARLNGSRPGQFLPCMQFLRPGPREAGRGQVEKLLAVADTWQATWLSVFL